MHITKFFENQEIFITGGSGFIGKGLLLKLLTAAPNVGKIYVLLRGKNGKNAEERLKDLLNLAIFKRLHQERSEVLGKLQAIDGDCSELGLGIRAADLEKLRHVSIIFHSAASVRFDDALRESILLNTRGTHELIKIAEQLKYLIAFVHVSTAYCNPDQKVVEEKIYPPYADWRAAIKMAETYGTEILNIINLKYSSRHPNTYTFTKNLSEQILQEYKDKLPLIIFRPSIVTFAKEEPTPGWVDNFNGPVGMFVASGLGILRTNYGNPNNTFSIVPVDVVVRSMLIACYKRGREGLNSSDVGKPLEVVNCTIDNISSVTIGQMLDLGKLVLKDNPFDKTVWFPGGYITRCWTWNLIKVLFSQLLFSILLDGLIRLAGQKPFFLKLQRRICIANSSLKVFQNNGWIFHNENFVALERHVQRGEMDKFAFLTQSNLIFEDYLRDGIRGMKEFLLNEPRNGTAGGRRRFRIFGVAHFFVQLVTVLLIARFLLRYLYRNYFSNI